MADLTPEGIEEATEALIQAEYDRTHLNRDLTYRNVAARIVTAYLEHAFPMVSSVDGLDALGFEAVIRDRHGDVFENHGIGWFVAGSEGMWMAEEINLPARVIYRGSQ